MFFETPELVEKLLPFLDLKSTLHLARTHVLTQNILAGSRIWNKLVRRTRLQDGGDLGLDQDFGLGVDLNEKMDVVRHLVAILKLMKDPKANMRDLLETICKRCPPDEVFRKHGSGTVTIDCPNHQDSHEILFGEFLLLEIVEGAFGTVEQKVEAISMPVGALGEPRLSALSSRLFRQQKKLTSLGFTRRINIESKDSAEAFKTLMQASSEITPGIGRCRPLIVWVDEPIGGEGWKVLAEGVKLYPSLPLKFFAVQKDDLDEASQEDIRVMWDAVEPSGGVSVGRDPEGDDYEWVDKNEGEGGWTRLAQIMEMSKEEWAAQFEELED